MSLAVQQRFKGTVRRRATAGVLALILGLTLLPNGAAWAEEATEPAIAGETTEADDTEVSGTESADIQPKDLTGAAEVPAPTDTAASAQALAPAVGNSDDDLPAISMNLSRYRSGTDPFTPGDNSAGNDASSTNDIVRVNDTVVYKVEYSVSKSDAKNLTWSVALPKGMEILEIPGYCKADGSSLLPASAGTPKVPLTAKSVDELSEQTLTCNVGNKSAATDYVFFTVKVLNYVHQGQTLAVKSASITADGLEQPVASTGVLPTVKASARLMWDLSKNSVGTGENSGYVWGPYVEPCFWDKTRACSVNIYSLYLSAPASGKGAMPAIGDITLTDDISPEALYPSMSADKIEGINADLEKYGARIDQYSGVLSNGPANVIDGNKRNATNSVRNSGSVNISKADPGKPVSIRIRNADTSLRSYPTKTYSHGKAIPANTAYAVATNVRMSTPVDTIRDFGKVNASGDHWTLPTRNAFTDLSISGFTASDRQTSADQPGPDSATYPGIHWNDYRTTTPSVTLAGSFSKDFAGVPGTTGNMTAEEFTPGNHYFEGPPGGAPLGSGGITVAPEQDVVSVLTIGGADIAVPAEVSAVACDAWDNTRLHLRAGSIPASSEAKGQLIGSAGQPVWVSGYNNVPDTPDRAKWATSQDETPDLKVQYSALTGSAGANSACGEDQGPWYDSPEQVPGNDPTLAAKGIYTGVARVRAHIVLPDTQGLQVANFNQVRAYVSIGMRVADSGRGAGDILPNWGSVKRVPLDRLDMQDVLDAPSLWGLSDYVPGTNVADPNGNVGKPGDRLILADAQARIVKKVRKGDTDAFSSTPPQVTGGDLVQYQLSPSLTSGSAATGVLKDVWVEDCLPASQTYSEATPTPTTVTPGSTPGDAMRPDCGAGETYVRWVFPKHEVNTTLDPIVLSVEVSPTASDGVYENTVVVWAEDDSSTLEQRSDGAQVQISNVAGVKLEKVALTPVTQVNRAGQAQNELNRWAVRLSNTLPAAEASAVSAPDMIDALPKNGALGSTFDGTFDFVSAVVTKGDRVTLLYTSAETFSANPQHASNAADGSTAWCDAPAGGTRVLGVGDCPAAADEVTGIRVQRPGAYESGKVIEVEISMVGIGNSADNVYVNRVMAAASGLDSTIGPLNRPETVIASTVGNRVWWDLNRNGLQDEFQGSPEPDAKSVPVNISGTDDLGNPVDLSAETDDTGKYAFASLRASDATGYVVTFEKPEGAEFTTPRVEETASVRSPGGDTFTELDSDADIATGASAPVALGVNSSDPTIDAGLLPSGGLQINKTLEGAGVGEFAVGDTLVFDVGCTFEGESVLEQQVTLEVTGADAITSDVLGPLPAFTSCKVTELEAGDADKAATPVDVTVPWNAATQQAGVVTASLTNFYSAGTLAVAKKLEGDEEAIEHMSDAVFEILVRCQIPEKDAAGKEKRVDVYSGSVKIKGGQTKMLVSDSGDPRYLPLGAKCFGEETDNGGANKVEVSASTFENGVEVIEGTPSDLQQLNITAVNTFYCSEELCPKELSPEGPNQPGANIAGLPVTGSQLGGSALVVLALMLGGGLLLSRRRSAV